MKALYPASHNIPSLPESLQAIKIARHSPCSSCSSGSCPGLRPPPDLDVVLDSDIYDDDSRSAPYLSTCVCGHRVRDHGANPASVGDNEFYRRVRVAVRLDELMEVCTRDYLCCRVAQSDSMHNHRIDLSLFTLFVGLCNCYVPIQV